MHNVSSTKTYLKILQRRHSVYLRAPKALFKSSEGGLHAKFSQRHNDEVTQKNLKIQG